LNEEHKSSKTQAWILVNVTTTVPTFIPVSPPEEIFIQPTSPIQTTPTSTPEKISISSTFPFKTSPTLTPSSVVEVSTPTLPSATTTTATTSIPQVSITFPKIAAFIGSTAELTTQVYPTIESDPFQQNEYETHSSSFADKLRQSLKLDYAISCQNVGWFKYKLDKKVINCKFGFRETKNWKDWGEFYVGHHN
jgi:hypothetical protein